MRSTIAAFVALGIVAARLPGQAADPAPFTFKSVELDLPGSDHVFPPGPNLDVVNIYCVICHSVGMVMNQPRLPHATWEAEVHKMIDAYRAPVPPNDVARIVAYLDAVKGADTH